jgi:hypothetical protein
MKDITDVGCGRTNNDDCDPEIEGARTRANPFDDKDSRQKSRKKRNPAQMSEMQNIGHKVSGVGTEYASEDQARPIGPVDFRNAFHRDCLFDWKDVLDCTLALASYSSVTLQSAAAS